MAFKIDTFLDSGSADKDVRQKMVSVHDDLLAAHKIVESVAHTVGVGAKQSEQVLLAVFQELRKQGCEPSA